MYGSEVMINFSNHIIMAFTQLLLDNHDLEICRQLVKSELLTVARPFEVTKAYRQERSR